MGLGILALVLIFLLFSRTSKLESRILFLEKKLFSGAPLPQSTAPLPPTPRPVDAKENIVPPPSQPVSLDALMRQEPPAPPQDSRVSPSVEENDILRSPGIEARFVAWLKEDWLLKVGAFTVFLGFVWLVSYAFLNGWVGPIGKIGLGLFAGTAILIGGWKRMLRFPAQGAVFLILGAVTILLTTFAARSLYHFFTPASAMAIMFLACAFLAFVSVSFKRFPLALSGLILSGLVPLFVSTGVPNYVGLYSYLMIVVLGSLWVVAVTEWKGITLGALLLVILYSAPQLSGTTSADLGLILVFIYAFTGLFFLANIIGIIRRKKTSLQIDLIVAMVNGLNILAWIHVAAVENWRSLIMSAWMLLFVIGAFLMSMATKRKEPFYVYVGIGLSMLATATAEELHGASLTLAYMFETVAVILLTQQILRDTRITQKVSFLVVGPALLTIQSMFSPAWNTGVFHRDFVVVLMMILVFFGLAMYFKSQKGEQDTLEDAEGRKAAWVNHFILGVVYATILLSLIYDGADLTLAYILETVLVILITKKLFKNPKVVETVSMLMFAPALLSIQSMTSSLWNTAVFHKDFLVLASVAAVFAWIGSRLQKDEPASRRLLPVYLGSSAFFASILLWLALHAGFSDKDSATTLALVIYTVTGIWAYTKGKLHQRNALRITGLLFLSFVFGRLFLIDIWQMDIAGRIITFFLIGALLMSTAFYTRKPAQNTPKP